jgi:hypothetical protein
MIRPQFTDPHEATRVSSFMEEAEHGRWRIKRFTQTQEEFDLHSKLLSQEGTQRAQLRLDRLVPPGTYLSLQRRAIPQEIKDHEEGAILDALDGAWTPIMSDTPAEIEGHEEVIENAHGRVLVTGLGLGCIVSALLAKPDVDHITVIEIDRDVIALTGPYYEDDPRVTIVNADALGFASLVKPGVDYIGESQLPFDYAWHDIWTHIADRNLDDDSLAEHGISYQTMFDAYAPFCDDQGAWAYQDALVMAEIAAREAEKAWEWNEVFLNAGREKQIDMLIEHAVRDSFHVQLPDGSIGMLHHDQPVPDEVLKLFEEHSPDMREHFAKLRDKAFADGTIDRLSNREVDPMGRPNEVEGANVATRR